MEFGDHHYLSIKIGMSDRLAYSAPPTAGSRKAEARKGREGVACESTPGVHQHASKQGQDDTEQSDMSACCPNRAVLITKNHSIIITKTVIVISFHFI